MGVLLGIFGVLYIIVDKLQIHYCILKVCFVIYCNLEYVGVYRENFGYIGHILRYVGSV